MQSNLSGISSFKLNLQLVHLWPSRALLKPSISMLQVLLPLWCSLACIYCPLDPCSCAGPLLRQPLLSHCSDQVSRPIMSSDALTPICISVRDRYHVRKSRNAQSEVCRVMLPSMVSAPWRAATLCLTPPRRPLPTDDECSPPCCSTQPRCPPLSPAVDAVLPHVPAAPAARSRRHSGTWSRRRSSTQS